MKQKVCMYMNISGALKNAGKKSMKGLLLDDNDNEMTNQQVRETLKECLANGEKYLPFGDCEHFSRIEGCMCFKYKIGNESN